MGVNKKKIPRKTPVSFVVIDNKHLNENGIRYFCALSKEFVLITTNTRHPAFNVEDENLHIIYQNELSLKDALIKLKSEYGCERITIQTGGTLNNLFLREKLFDYVDIIIAPVLIGGKDTSTLIDGKSLTEECELSKLGVVKLQECVVLENSYLRLRYEVIHWQIPVYITGIDLQLWRWLIMEYTKKKNWIIAIAVAIVYLTISILFDLWFFSWIIWVAYAIYRFIVK